MIIVRVLSFSNRPTPSSSLSFPHRLPIHPLWSFSLPILSLWKVTRPQYRSLSFSSHGPENLTLLNRSKDPRERLVLVSDLEIDIAFLEEMARVSTREAPRATGATSVKGLLGTASWVTWWTNTLGYNFRTFFPFFQRKQCWYNSLVNQGLDVGPYGEREREERVRKYAGNGEWKHEDEEGKGRGSSGWDEDVNRLMSWKFFSFVVSFFSSHRTKRHRRSTRQRSQWSPETFHL